MRTRDEVRLLRWCYTCFVEPATNLGCYRTRRLGPTGNFNVNFFLPSDFARLISARLIGIPLDDFSNKTIRVTLETALVGEPRDARHATRDFIFSGAAGFVTGFDVTPLLAELLRASGLGGLTIDHQAIGTSIDYLGLEISYSAIVE
jgi:hypothetical protein